MFVDNDFFDNDDDDKLQMNASPYTNRTSENTTTGRAGTFGNRSTATRKEFDVNGEAVYADSTRNQLSDIGQLQPKESTRKKQVISFKSRGQLSLGANSQGDNGQKSGTQSTFSYNENQQSQKQAFNDDMDFTDLGNDNYNSKPTQSKSNWDQPSDNFRASNQFESSDLTRPGTSSNREMSKQGLLQSRQRLLDQNRMQFSGASTFQSNDTFVNKTQSNQAPLYYKNEETKDSINYNELQKYAYDSKKEFYDPTLKKSEKAQFSLSKMSQNIKYERDEEYIPPTRDDIQVKELSPYREEKNEPDENSEKGDDDRDDEEEDDQMMAKKMAEEAEKKRLLEKEVVKQPAPKEAKVEMVSKPQEHIDEPPVRELKLLNPEYLDTVDMKTFLTRPTPKGYLVQCNIKREKSGFGIYPKYYVTLSNGFRFLMAGKKNAGNATSTYTVSMAAKDFSTKSKNFLGKVRSNFLGTEFNIWDTGLAPSKTKNPDALREQLAVVLYERNILGSKGPRKMHVLLPDIKPNGEQYKFKPLSSKEGMLQNYQAKRFEGFKEYYNKPPRWNEQYQAFVLNFNGRVEKPSVKNFQLVHESDENTIMLQFGRVTKDTFTMDFQWPISPMQAFSICLTSFDYKLACE